MGHDLKDVRKMKPLDLMPSFSLEHVSATGQWLHRRRMVPLSQYVFFVTEKDFLPFLGEASRIRVEKNIRHEFQKSQLNGASQDFLWQTVETTSGYRFIIPILSSEPLLFSFSNMHISLLPPAWGGFIATILVLRNSISEMDGLKSEVSSLINGLLRYAELHPEYDEIIQCIE